MFSTCLWLPSVWWQFTSTQERTIIWCPVRKFMIISVLTSVSNGVFSLNLKCFIENFFGMVSHNNSKLTLSQRLSNGKPSSTHFLRLKVRLYPSRCCWQISVIGLMTSLAYAGSNVNIPSHSGTRVTSMTPMVARSESLKKWFKVGDWNQHSSCLTWRESAAYHCSGLLPY